MSRQNTNRKENPIGQVIQGVNAVLNPLDALHSLSNQMLINNMQNNPQGSMLDNQMTNPGQTGSNNFGLNASLGNQETQRGMQANNQAPAPAQAPPPKENNILIAMHYLTTKYGWEPEFAAAWLGQAVVETGDPELKDLDVVEQVGGAGRGMMQYTDARRGPYDNARWRAIQNGQDVNDVRWQIDYALKTDNAGLRFNELYNGLTDPQTNYTFEPRWGTALGISPSGVHYRDKYRTANELMSAYGEDKIGGYTRALTGEYTRPGEPHLDRRLKAARDIFSSYKRWISSQSSKPQIV